MIKRRMEMVDTMTTYRKSMQGKVEDEAGVNDAKVEAGKDDGGVTEVASDPDGVTGSKRRKSIAMKNRWREGVCPQNDST